MEQCEIDTRLGKIRGRSRSGVNSFLGVRYADPPKRYFPPVQAAGWPGVYDATKHGPQAIQPVHDEALMLGLKMPGGFSEDCLFLNIYAPARRAGSLMPVMVWIHGGGFVEGSANQYDGTMLAKTADVVVVCINYRLGIWGNMDLRPLGSGFEKACNVWFHDQVTALTWVKGNIADYGGDPGNVTVFGQSAGGTSVTALIASPRARSLIHKAIANSPAFMTPEDPKYLAGVAKVKGMSVADAGKHLLEADADELLRLSSKTRALIYPFIDGDVIPAPPDVSIRSSGLPPIPLISGFASHDGQFLEHSYRAQKKLTIWLRIVAHAVTPLAAGSFSESGAYMKRLKKVQRPRGSSQLSNLVWTDIHRKASVIHVDATTAAGGRAWHYLFDVPCIFNGKRVPSTHCVDIPFTFNWFEDSEIPRGNWVEDSEENRALARAWVDALSRFARTGDPQGGPLGEWPAYGERRNTRVIATDRSAVLQDIDPEYRTQIWPSAARAA